MNKLLPSYIWLILLLAYCTLIYGLSSQSHLPISYVFNSEDKLIHASAYAGMAFLFWQVIQARHVHDPFENSLLWAIVCVLFCSLYGITDEWHQSFVPGRDASVFDWMADTTGAFLLTIVLYKRKFMTLRVK